VSVSGNVTKSLSAEYATFVYCLFGYIKYRP